MLFKQPNDKFTYITEGQAIINITEEEYWKLRLEEFINQIDTELKNCKMFEFSTQQLKSMGYDK